MKRVGMIICGLLLPCIWCWDFSDSICAMAGTVMLFIPLIIVNCEGEQRGTAIVIAEEDSCLS